MWISKGCVAALMVALLARTATGGNELKTMPEKPREGETLFVFPDETASNMEFHWSAFFNGAEVPESKGGPGNQEGGAKRVTVEFQGPWLKVSSLQEGSYVFVLTGKSGDDKNSKETRWATSLNLTSEPARNSDPPPKVFFPIADSEAPGDKPDGAAESKTPSSKPYVEQPPVSDRVVLFLADYLAKQQPQGPRSPVAAGETLPPATSRAQAVGQKQFQRSEVTSSESIQAKGATFPDLKEPTTEQSRKESEETQQKVKEREKRETALQRSSSINWHATSRACRATTAGSPTASKSLPPKP